MTDTLNDRWIPCDKELPDKPDVYIATLKDGRVIADYWNNPQGMGQSCIAWMPKPSAYRKEAHEEIC